MSVDLYINIIYNADFINTWFSLTCRLYKFVDVTPSTVALVIHK
jgi:hypothetical protein